jgi:NDP-4-keto-2,6-dideoxyhexose 3-C-methyltransferase
LATTSASVATELVKAVTHCRACGSGQLDEVLDLGTHAVSDFYAVVPEDELRAPLCLVQCEACGLVQLTYSVSRERLYKDYWYRSGLNPSMVVALKDVVEDIYSRVDLKLGDVVMDIGANDGTLLSHYQPGLDTCGFEPSQFWREAVMQGHNVLDGFYPTWRFSWPGEKPKAISSIAMFYDLDDPNAFVKAIKEDLHPEGVWICQFMDLEGMLRANAFDNVCAEHVAYWSLEDFDRLVASHGLRIEAVSRNDTNGGSIRLTMRHGQEPLKTAPSSYKYALRAFGRRIPQLKGQCLDFLEASKSNGKTVLGLGSSTKFNTLLQFYGITPELLPAIMDRNPDKVGKITAGSHIPIISEEEGRARKPDYFLIGPWHFLDNLREREAAYLNSGGRFVVPLPEFRVVGPKS